MRVMLFTSGAVLLLTCVAYFTYEYYSFRQTTAQQLATLGKIIAANSTAALAFESKEDADEILGALSAEPHIIEACLYDKDGKRFAHYPADLPESVFPAVSSKSGYSFESQHLSGFQPVLQGDKQLGTLFLKSDVKAMYERFKLYGSIALLVIALSFVMVYFLSRLLQRSITKPILSLAQTAQAITYRQDYSVRAQKMSRDELGMLTDAFNQMLNQIQIQTHEIQLFNQRLEQSIAERTVELEIANKELESFSYSVSHDLRAPLRSIDGYSRIMLEDYGDKLDDNGKRTLNVIIKNALRMGTLIDDLLAFSRLGKQNVTKVNLSMDFLTTTVVEELRSQYKKEAEILVGPLLDVEGDSSMIKQVMTNLISNALKYSMKKEKPVVEIGSFEQNGNHVYYVKDNGAGFDMQYYDKLFGVFQRLHSTHEFEGTGVGLALVHRIVTKHGGKIWAEGVVDVGATFYFALPTEKTTVQST
jgi:signal transduction histidine kinase